MTRLGAIGLSPGNGHPYSWAAIFNGYDTASMADCPFPAIPEYLATQAEQPGPVADPEDGGVHAGIETLSLSDPSAVAERHIAHEKGRPPAATGRN